MNLRRKDCVRQWQPANDKASFRIYTMRPSGVHDGLLFSMLIEPVKDET